MISSLTSGLVGKLLDQPVYGVTRLNGRGTLLDRRFFIPLVMRLSDNVSKSLDRMLVQFFTPVICRFEMIGRLAGALTL